MREGNITETSQIELFLNSVPILSSLSREEKLRLVDALVEVPYPSGSTIIRQGEPGDLFYIIKDGEAVVYQNTPQGLRKVNHLFRADFFGERALLCDEPRYGIESSCRHPSYCVAYMVLHSLGGKPCRGCIIYQKPHGYSFY